MKCCDVCGKKDCALVDLLSIYKTPEISDICTECMAVINTQLSKIRGVTAQINCSLLKRFMASLRGKEKK